MKHRETTLLLAGAAATLSVVLSSVSLTTAVIAAARPSVLQYLTAADNAVRIGYTQWQWVLGMAILCLACWVLSRIVSRRPWPTGIESRSTTPADEPVITRGEGLFLSMGLFMLAFAGWVILRGYGGLAANPLTDSPDFASLSGLFFSPAITFACSSSVLFARWSRGAPTDANGGSGASP